MLPDRMATRRRLLEDFRFYADNALFIRTKEQTITTLKLNTAQERLQEIIDRQLATRGYVRIVILKGRQMGLSTMVGGWLYWWVSQRRAQKAMVVAHKAEATQTLFDMTRRYHDKMPDILRPSTRYSSRKELVFDKLDSSYTVITAGGEGVARGETITAAHLSELAFWPKSSAAANFSGLMDTIPSGRASRGTAVFIESTANGMSGLFYDQCQLARKGESDFEFIFLPWFIDEKYRAEVPEGFERTPEEDELVATYGLDDEQLMFRRHRIAEKGVDLFKQEYPCNPDEAFLTSGHPVFPADRLVKAKAAATPPIARKTLALSSDGTWQWENAPHGELHCFAPHSDTETYYIGADVALGVRKDRSVAQVLDSSKRQVAVWRSDRVDPDHFGVVLAHLGRLFNDAFIVCERNNHGLLTNRVLVKDMEYRYYWTEREVDKISDTETERVGFYTSEKTKPLIIGGLRASLVDGEITLMDPETIDELRSYIQTPSGKLEAEKGSFDDHVISLALCNHVHEGGFIPIRNLDSFYLPSGTY